MVEGRVGKDFEAGADGTPFGIVGAIDEAGDTCLDDCARTHAARLDGNVEHGISKTVVAEKAGGVAQNDNFGVSSGVTIANCTVAGTNEDLSIVDKHCADWNFAGCRCGMRFRQVFLHELYVSFHLARENNMRRDAKPAKYCYTP